MPADRVVKTASYRLHKPSGNAVVTLPSPFGARGRDVYLGQHGSPESRRADRRAARHHLR